VSGANADRDPAHVHLADQQLAALQHVPDEVVHGMIEAISQAVVEGAERGASGETISGWVHGTVALIIAPLLMEGRPPAVEPKTVPDSCQHRWGMGLGDQFRLGSIEENQGLLLQVCGDCGARRLVR
jgi:hypothetical protein